MSEEPNKELETSRRAFLKQAGKLAVYAPPVMMAMSSPTFAGNFKKSGGVTYPRKSKKKKPKKFFGYSGKRA